MSKGIKIVIFSIILIVILFVVSFQNSIERKKFRKKYIKDDNIIYNLKQDIRLPEVELGTEIPHKIYRCHKDSQNIGKYKIVIEKTKDIMPEYEQIIYDDPKIEKFIQEKYGKRIYNAYMKINPSYGPAKADLFRMLIIYLNGGIYLDIKSCPKKHLSKILDQTKLNVSRWTNLPLGGIKNINFSNIVDSKFGEYQNWHICSPKGNPILKKVIQQIVSNIESGDINNKYFCNGELSVLIFTGPITYSLTINNQDKKYIKKHWANLNDSLCYDMIGHKKIEGQTHYSSLKDKRILLY